MRAIMVKPYPVLELECDDGPCEAVKKAISPHEEIKAVTQYSEITQSIIIGKT